MKWHKLGLLFRAEGQYGWMNSHTQVPTVLPLKNSNLLRVYFSTRPRAGLSQTGFLDIDAADPTRITYLHARPILELGAPGTFDEHGIMPQCCVRQGDGRIFLYYLGWSRRIGIPYSNWVGLAISEDDGMTFYKAFDGPILDRTRNEIFSATGLYVLPDGNNFRGWYAKGLGWSQIGGRLEERYLITETSSQDGIEWTRSGRIVVPTNDSLEAMTCPVVLRLENRWLMWYCKRKMVDFRDGLGAYRIGLARSIDGETWVRDDENVGIEPSATGWDSTMMAYPKVVQVENKLLMFYCGNGFGAGGLGVAEYIIDAPRYEINSTLAP